MPVGFQLPANWRAKPVRLDGGPMDSLISQGGATLACEVDPKPAGKIGFLRVWVAKRDAELRPAIESFLAAERGLTDVAYRDLDAGGMTAIEATYLRRSELEKTGKRERVLGVAAPQGIAVLTLSGLDNAQYEAMLPAYSLMRRSLAAAG